MATKTKSKTLGVVPQSKDDCASAIRQIGDLQREAARINTLMNDAIAEITERNQPQLTDLRNRIEALQAGVQIWCESHRAEMLGPNDAKGKTANLITGDISWRVRPPSVSIKGEEKVIKTLKERKLGRFVRIKEAVDKEAILKEPRAVEHIDGITINSGVEDFIVSPFEVDLEAA